MIEPPCRAWRQQGYNIFEGAGGDSFKIADNLGDGISAYLSPFALAGGIAESEVLRGAVRNSAKAYNIAYSSKYQAVLKYNKVLGATGKVLGVAGVVTSLGEIYEDGLNWTNGTKAAINIGILFMKANPIGLTVSLGVGLLDYTGYLDGGLNYLYEDVLGVQKNGN